MLTSIHGIYQSSLLTNRKGIFHGFSTRTYGDARVPQNASKILEVLEVPSITLASAQQVHGGKVARVGQSPLRVTPGVDALVTTAKGLALEVHVADCVPVIMVDPIAHVVAAIHAGWKGTRDGIVGAAVKEMEAYGAHVKRIVAVIGPHIGMCCYSVDEERAKLFQDIFHRDPNISSYWGDSWHIDLGYGNRKQLVDAGISADHIDSRVVCTSCQVDSFFSYRKDTKETFGEIIGVIGMK